MCSNAFASLEPNSPSLNTCYILLSNQSLFSSACPLQSTCPTAEEVLHTILIEKHEQVIQRKNGQQICGAVIIDLFL